ncbi:aminoglycoside phosphotransferase family protein [Kitasatospora sp. NPDC058170]|uniref:aminoglycoside phosphotransferase family protein n=1 Tax=Kitasatospora sp. NPDC058170 TaxID=3346364 RepID=UPI0036DA43E2
MSTGPDTATGAAAGSAAGAGVTAVPAEVRARFAVRFGPAAEAWCEALPALVERLARRWELTVQAAGGGGTARVFRCERSADGARVWLKLTPDGQVAAHEAAALRAWLGLAEVVRLLDHDADAAALLLADVRPGRTLRERPWEAAEVAGVLSALRSTPVDGVGLPPLRERVDFLFDLTERRAPGVVPPEARAFALELADSGPLALVHGDLHPGNVLDGPAGPVAIDPRPTLGDPDFDLVDWAVEGVTDRAGLERRIADLTALVPGSDPERVLGWCRATAAIVAAPRAAAGRRDPGTVFLLDLAGLPTP